MRKVAIFTEGQGEQIFIRRLLVEILGWEAISFDCIRLYSRKYKKVPYSHSNSNAEIYFEIVNVGNDETVLSAIKERETTYINKGFEKIIALRDMYSERYLKEANNRVDKAVIESFLEGWNSTIKGMKNSTKIKTHCSIMELEAWFLGMYNIFEKHNAKLTLDFIEQELRFNLRKCDPQNKFIKPTNQINDIYQLVGEKYDKSYDAIESICSHITCEDIHNALENDRCQSFGKFYNEIMNL